MWIEMCSALTAVDRYQWVWVDEDDDCVYPQTWIAHLIIPYRVGYLFIYGVMMNRWQGNGAGGNKLKSDVVDFVSSIF